MEAVRKVSEEERGEILSKKTKCERKMGKEETNKKERKKERKKEPIVKD